MASTHAHQKVAERMKEEKSRALNSNSINAGLFSVPSYTTIGDEFEKPIRMHFGELFCK